ncbi:MAG: NirD/YgiW/YdeI family stress tolerance protein [Gammaproteobacteria bacterium]
MKNVLIAAGLALASSVAVAGSASSGGFTGPDNLTVVTVKEALGMRDDSPVKLQGYILQSLGDEKYEFKDDSGTMTIEVDNDDWRGVQASPDLKVELIGEIDKELRKTTLDVDVVRLLP